MRAEKFICFLLMFLVCASAPSSSHSARVGDYAPQVGQEGKDAVWVPTPQALVDKMLDLAKLTPKDFLIDLGSGDGRLVIAAAKRGAKALGVEYNPDLVELSKRHAVEAGVSERASFEKADLFKTDLSQAQVISMFLLSTINRRLRPKLLNLKPGTRIVTNTFDLGEWRPETSATIPHCDTWCTANLWIVPAKVEGIWKMPEGELNIAQEFQVISGQFKFGTSVGLISGKLYADQISFTAGNRHYSGRVAGNSMTGTAAGRQWTASRVSK